MAVEIFGDGKSFARKLVDPTSMWLMTQLHHEVPSITPDHITKGGTALCLVAAYLQEQAHIENRELSVVEKTLIVLLKGIGNLADKGDGSMADVYDREEPGKHDRFKGQRTDAIYDRRGEVGAALLRARTAYYKSSLVGEVAAYAAANTCVMPSIERARIETLGFKPPEMGGNLLEALGTRSIRAVFTEVALLRTIGGINVQPWVDLAAAAANLNTARSRREVYNKYKDLSADGLGEDEECKRAQTILFARARLADMEKVQREIIVASGATFVSLRT